jgi:hypothetical protein
VFLGGGLDPRFRAYDSGTGEVLATFDLGARIPTAILRGWLRLPMMHRHSG